MRCQLAICIFLVGAAGLLFAAPAPLPKPAKPAPVFRAQDLAGEWALVWNGEPCIAGFGSGGGFSCIFLGELWTGSWRFDDKGRLEVTESRAGSEGTLRWHVEGVLGRRHIHGKAVMDCGEVTLDMKKSKE